jgi:6-phospho-3-hexuloisomerase
MMSDHADIARRAAQDIGAAAAATDPASIDAAVAEIAQAQSILCHGVGREGLMMRALAMRLCHLGCDAHVVGDMSAPPVGPRDLLIVSAGPGDLPTVGALADVARQAGARTLCVTAQPLGPVPAACDRILEIPAQTMANDRGAAASSVLPMGSVFEGAQFLVFEILVLALRARLGITPEAMRARHTNLE